MCLLARQDRIKMWVEAAQGQGREEARRLGIRRVRRNVWKGDEEERMKEKRGSEERVRNRWKKGRTEERKEGFRSEVE